jgi:serine/threonine protein kinase
MIGTQVGQLVLERWLGKGAMGAVFLATHSVLRTERAVKILLPEFTQNVDITRRFMNEARAAASMLHRNIIAVHDCGQLPSGEWFIVMDYVDGATLRRVIEAQRGPLAVEATVHVFAEICNGLQVAHDHNIIHRDLKPDNIYISNRDGDPYRVSLLDFGVAKFGEEISGGGAGTRTGALIGTPSFMSAEQLRGAKVTAASDIYALGVILYQMCSGGRLPYQSEAGPMAHYDFTPAEMYHRQISGPPVDIRPYAPGISTAWVEVIHAALHPDPRQRPGSAREFALRVAETAPSGASARLGSAGFTSGLAIVQRYAHELLAVGPHAASLLIDAPSNHGHPSGRPLPPSLLSRYQLGRKLGVGGMAEVFAGTAAGAEGFARQVAIKRVLAGFSDVPAFVAMFIEEARIASRLSHPNIVSVLDFDRDPEGRLFLVMEYVEGCNLSGLLDTGPLPLPVALFVVEEMLSGLGYAHQPPDHSGLRGVVHRDISPHNVLLSWEGAVKVSDFGIAKALDASAATSAGTLKGKPAYMSPEQANGESLDGRSDLFSVGIVLWEMLTGHRLFTGTSQGLMAQVLFRDIPRPSAVNPRIPADVEAVVMKLLHRSLPHRYARAEPAIEDLSQCAAHPLNGRGELIKLLAARFTPQGEPRAPRRHAATTLSGAASHSSQRRRLRRRYIIAAAVGALLIASVALISSQSGDGLAPASARPGAAAASAPGALPPPLPTVQLPPSPAIEAAITAPRRTDAGVADAGIADAGIADAGVAAPPVAAATATQRGASGSVPAVGMGQIVVRIDPWARVWIDDVEYGQTPVVAKVRAGRHRVRIEKLTKKKTVFVTVRTAKQSIIEETW